MCVCPVFTCVPPPPAGGMAVSVGMSGGNMVYIPVMSGMPQMMFPQGYTLPTATPPTTSQPLAFSLPVPGSQPAYTYALPVPAPTTPPVFPLAAAVTVASPEAVTQSPTHLPSPTATAKPSTPPPTLSDASLLLEMREGESPRKA
ncbi:MAG: hypothetical protein P4L40_07520 [Terracidiphilus sp.]|nr:hypothetical protein [Terracidiphilus sp.]